MWLIIKHLLGNIPAIIVLFLLFGCHYPSNRDIPSSPDADAIITQPGFSFHLPRTPPSPIRRREKLIESCALCYAQDAMANGPLNTSLTYKKSPLDLSDVSSLDPLIDRYQASTYGNDDWEMSSFADNSLSQHWDMLSYLLFMNTSSDELVGGGLLLHESYFSSYFGVTGSDLVGVSFDKLEMMSDINGLGINWIIEGGNEMMRGFKDNLKVEKVWILSSIIKSFSFIFLTDDLISTTTPEFFSSDRHTPEKTQDEIGTEASVAESFEGDGFIVQGKVSLPLESPLPAGLIVKLILIDMTTSTVVATHEVEVNLDGTYEFRGIVGDPQTACWVSVVYDGVTYFSNMSTFDSSSTIVDLPVSIYESSTEWRSLRYDLVHITFEVTSGTLHLTEIFLISNPGDKSIILQTDGTHLPFIELPDGFSTIDRISPESSGGRFLPADGGVAVAPMGDAQYGIVASFTTSYQGSFVFSQNFPIPISTVVLYVPNGLSVQPNLFISVGTQEIGGNQYDIFRIHPMPAGTLEFGLFSKGIANASSSLIIILSILGIVFLGIGLFLCIRERLLGKSEKQEMKHSNTEAHEKVKEEINHYLDMIIALDNDKTEGKLSARVYAKRRGELISGLKDSLRKNEKTKAGK